MKLALMLAAALALSGCEAVSDWWEGGCGKEQQNAINNFGQPDPTPDTYSTDGFNIETYWWRSIGYGESFTWGSSVTGCERSTFTYPPRNY